jgi:hypothetical protein
MVERVEEPIDELYAYVVVGPDGREGILGGFIGSGWMCFVTGRPDLADRMRASAVEIARATGVKIRLVRFTERKYIEDVEP